MQILIAGFPHSGAGILRKVIGNHAEVCDEHQTDMLIYRPKARNSSDLAAPGEEESKHVVFNWPFHQVEGRTNADRIVYVIRDPRDVFGSLRQRFGAARPEDHSPQAWQAYAKFFLARQTGLRHYRHFLIRYEDMFDADHLTLKKLFAWLNLPWHADVLHTQARYAPTNFSGAQPAIEPSRSDAAAFRAWQTSQAFECKTAQSRQHLDAATAAVLACMPECDKLGYPIETSSPGRKEPAMLVPRSNIRNFNKAVVSASIPAFLLRSTIDQAP